MVKVYCGIVWYNNTKITINVNTKYIRMTLDEEAPVEDCPNIYWRAFPPPNAPHEIGTCTSKRVFFQILPPLF